MPTSQSSNLVNEVEIVKGVYAGLNRNDISAALAFFDPQIERVEFEGHPSGGAYHGFEEVKAHFLKGRSTWAEGSCQPERFLVVGDKILVFVYVRVKLKSNMEWVEGRAADVFTFRNGKIIQMHTFAEAQQALQWAGVKDSETN